MGMLKILQESGVINMGGDSMVDMDFGGIIKPKYDKVKTVKGVKYYIIYRWWEVVILRVVKAAQKGMWFCGIAWHDPVFGECTPDFNCCCNIGRKAWIKFSQKSVVNHGK